METQLSETLKFWLQTQFQNTIEMSMQLNKKYAPEQTPYVHKYEAIQQLNRLNQKNYPYKFIVYCLLGEIYNDVQQTSDSVKSYQNGLREFEKLSVNQIHKFYQYLIVIYNMLGLSYINRQSVEEGLGCLGKAIQIYQAFQESPNQNVYHYRTNQTQDRQFRYLYQGGNDHEEMEDSYTLTLFYLAQAYTKIGLKDKAAEYCGMTLQRQHSNKKYQIKQFVNNLIGLAQYYRGNKYFAQSQYLLMLALKIIPEGQKKKLRATVHIGIGDMIGQMLEFGCQRIVNNDVSEADNNIVSKQMIIFKQFDQGFPKITLPTDIEGCKSLFRQANTQFKKAIDVFVLDGYVTEHIQILFSQSKLYHSLAILQKSLERKIAMTDKRRQMLEPLLKELNPKAYPGTWQKILVEVSEIINELFNLKISNLSAKGAPSDQKINQSCQTGKKSIEYYQMIIVALLDDKQTPKNEQYYRSILNSKINIAKATSKLLSSDRKIRVQYLKQSWKLYQGVIDYIKKQIPEQHRKCFEKEIQLTNQMIAMMPNKIDRINYGQVAIFQ